MLTQTRGEMAQINKFWGFWMKERKNQATLWSCFSFSFFFRSSATTQGRTPRPTRIPSQPLRTSCLPAHGDTGQEKTQGLLENCSHLFQSSAARASNSSSVKATWLPLHVFPVWGLCAQQRQAVWWVCFFEAHREWLQKVGTRYSHALMSFSYHNWSCFLPQLILLAVLSACSFSPKLFDVFSSLPAKCFDFMYLRDRRQLPAFCFKRTMFVWEGEGRSLFIFELLRVVLHGFSGRFGDEEIHNITNFADVEAFIAKPEFVDVFCRADSRSSRSRPVASAVSDAQNEWRTVRSNPAQEEAREKP